MLTSVGITPPDARVVKSPELVIAPGAIVDMVGALVTSGTSAGVVAANGADVGSMEGALVTAGTSAGVVAANGADVGGVVGALVTTGTAAGVVAANGANVGTSVEMNIRANLLLLT